MDENGLAVFDLIRHGDRINTVVLCAFDLLIFLLCSSSTTMREEVGQCAGFAGS